MLGVALPEPGQGLGQAQESSLAAILGRQGERPVAAPPQAMLFFLRFWLFFYGFWLRFNGRAVSSIATCFSTRCRNS
jgi:hypothetical protein